MERAKTCCHAIHRNCFTFSDFVGINKEGVSSLCGASLFRTVIAEKHLKPYIFL